MRLLPKTASSVPGRTLLPCALLLAACGGSAKPAEAPAPAPTTPAPATPAPVSMTPPAQEAVTCEHLAGKMIPQGWLDLVYGVPIARRASFEMELRQAYVESCTADQWPEEVLTCGRDTEAADASECLGTLTEEQGDALMLRFKPLRDEVMRAPSPIPDGARKRAFASPPAVLVECGSYLEVLEAFIACDQVPVQAKDAVVQAVAALQQSFSPLADPNAPPKAIAAANDGCKQASAAIRQSALSIGCDPSKFQPPPEPKRPPPKAPGKPPKRKK